MEVVVLTLIRIILCLILGTIVEIDLPLNKGEE